MALKDRFDKIISYFDTDDVSENEVHEVQTINFRGYPS